MKKMQIAVQLFFMMNSENVFSMNFRGAGKSTQALCRSFQNKQVTKKFSSSKKDLSSDNSHEIIIGGTLIACCFYNVGMAEGRKRGQANGHQEGKRSGYASGYEAGKIYGLKLAQEEMETQKRKRQEHQIRIEDAMKSYRYEPKISGVDE